MRGLLAKMLMAAAVLQIASCESNSSADDLGGSIGPKFWLFDVSDYNRTDEDVVYGLGGRWISVRYVLHDGVMVDRSEKLAEIVDAFTKDGWTQEELPSEKYVLSEIYEFADRDICFRRSARDGESEHWTFRTIIHVSEGGGVICHYCEVGW